MVVENKIINAMRKQGFSFYHTSNGYLYFSKGLAPYVPHRVNPVSMELQVCNEGDWVTIGSVHEWLLEQRAFEKQVRVNDEILRFNYRTDRSAVRILPSDTTEELFVPLGDNYISTDNEFSLWVEGYVSGVYKKPTRFK